MNAETIFDEEPISFVMPQDDAGNKFPLPPGHVSGVIIGKSGSGKTTLLLALIPLFGKLSQVIICTKIMGNPVHDAIREWCEAKDVEYGIAYDPNESMKLIEDMVSKKEEGTYGLIVFDDFCQGCSNNRDNKYTKIMITAYQQLRNYGYRTLSITQSYTGVCTLCRNNANFMVLFPMTNIHSIRSAVQDILQASDLTPDEANAILRRVQQDEHGYMMVSTRKVYIHLPSMNGGKLFLYKRDMKKKEDDDESEE